MDSRFTYEKMKNFLAKNIIIISIVLISLTYIISGFVAIKENGKTFFEILGESTLVFLFSYFIIQSFSLQGILNGEDSKEVVNQRQEHIKIKQTLGEKISKLSGWLLKKNMDIEKEIKTEALCDFGITYKDLISDNFDKTKFSKKELKKLKQIKTKKITKLTASEILNENFKKNNPLYLGQTKKSFLTQRNLSTLTTKLIFTLLFGYFSTAFIGFNVEELIWKLIQVVMFLILGVMEYYRSYMYMTGEYAEIISKKIVLLKEFSHYIEKEGGED
ncbi:MAG: hypothetical protein IJW82_07345 [Clostridia bacterium]|nr:hypothetical protein [Clostridia bacterium]